jgi:hypothetical protein
LPSGSFEQERIFMQINLSRRPSRAMAGDTSMRMLDESELRHVSGGQRTRAILGDAPPPPEPPPV